MMRSSPRSGTNPSPLKLPERDSSLPIGTTMLDHHSDFIMPRHTDGQSNSIHFDRRIQISLRGSTSLRQLCISACLVALARISSAQTITTSSPSSKTSSADAATTSLPGGSTNSRLQVVIPVVAGVVVLAVVAMMIFIKCASNRQSSRRGRKRRKRGAELEGGAPEYEGVPA
jgi:hypothetical protein